MRVPYSETDRLTKIMDGKTSISDLLGRRIDGAHKKYEAETDKDKKAELEGKLNELKAVRNSEFCEIYSTDDALRRVIDMALKIEGMPRQTGIHAAGVVICQKRGRYLSIRCKGNRVARNVENGLSGISYPYRYPEMYTIY